MMNLIIIFSAKYLYLFIIAIALVMFWRFKENRKEIFTMCIISFPLMYILLILAGHLYYDPRPFVAHHFKPLIPHAPDNGFPSDHMLLVSAITMLFFYFRRKASIILWILAIAVGTARVIAGIHHWTDILGSMFIAVFTVWLTYNYFMPLIRKMKKIKKHFGP